MKKLIAAVALVACLAASPAAWAYNSPSIRGTGVVTSSQRVRKCVIGPKSECQKWLRFTTARGTLTFKNKTAQDRDIVCEADLKDADGNIIDGTRKNKRMYDVGAGLSRTRSFRATYRENITAVSVYVFHCDSYRRT